MSERVDRLGLHPIHRLIVVSGIASTYGLFHGISRGAKLSSLRYLAENAHRLPRTKGTWYFFHKRKNNVVLYNGINAGVTTAAKCAAVTAAFFGLEATIDHFTNRVSWISTTGSSFLLASAISASKRLSWQQSLRSIRNFTIFGATAGYVQDRVRSLSDVSREKRRLTDSK